MDINIVPHMDVSPHPNPRLGKEGRSLAPLYPTSTASMLGVLTDP